MRAFDFAHTISNGYSYRDFCIYMALRRPWIWLYLPVIIFVATLKLFHIVKMKHVVEWVLKPFYRLKHEHIVRFWDKHEKRLGQWYRDIHRDDDVVISATPAFFLEEACRRIGVTNLIATEIDMKTGKVIDPYCYREGKWERFVTAYGEDARLEAYYTDTPKDSGMLDRAEEGYLVKKGKITRIR